MVSTVLGGCRVFSVAQRTAALLRRNQASAVVADTLTRDNIDRLALAGPGGIKGLYVIPPVGCLLGSHRVVFGNASAIATGNLQHKNIASHVGLQDPEAGTQDPVFWGFRIVPLTFIFGGNKATNFFRNIDGKLILGIWEGHRENIGSHGEKVKKMGLIGEIEKPTAFMLRKENIYGYLLPRAPEEEFVRPWVILGDAGINPKTFPWEEAPYLLRAIARQAYPDFFVFSFFSRRVEHISSPNGCVSIHEETGFVSCHESSS